MEGVSHISYRMLPQMGINILGPGQNQMPKLLVQAYRWVVSWLAFLPLDYFLSPVWGIPGLHWDFWPQQQKTSYTPPDSTHPPLWVLESLLEEGRGVERQREVLGLVYKPPHYLSHSGSETSFICFVFFWLDSSIRKWNCLRHGGPNFTSALPRNLC